MEGELYKADSDTGYLIEELLQSLRRKARAAGVARRELLVLLTVGAIKAKTGVSVTERVRYEVYSNQFEKGQ